MYTLEINAVFHDSSACLLKDGKLISAAEEERFTPNAHRLEQRSGLTCRNIVRKKQIQEMR